MTVNVDGYGRGLNVVINKVYTDTCPKVGLLVTLSDKNANPLGGLTKDSFSLFENGVAKLLGRSLVKSPVSIIDPRLYVACMGAILSPTWKQRPRVDQLNPGNHDEAEIVKLPQML
jgi:hypothetical protein